MGQPLVETLQSQLKAATEALRRCEERSAAGRLALEVMHELRNPLEALGYLNRLALQDAEFPDKVRQYLLMADEQIATVERVASGPLDFARSPSALKPVELGVVAESALRIHRRAIEAKSIHLVKSCPKGIVAQIYTGEMLQVFSNLIANALDALPDRGILSLRIRKLHGKIQLIIADNGCGVPHAHREAVFEPFFTTKRDHGTGLGLSLCKKIVEHHNGKIRMRSSVDPGRHGTAFRISLPA
jgi:signal transduction histidine kinase